MIRFFISGLKENPVLLKMTVVWFITIVISLIVVYQGSLKVRRKWKKEFPFLDF